MTDQSPVFTHGHVPIEIAGVHTPAGSMEPGDSAAEVAVRGGEAQIRRATDEDVPALTSLVHAAYAEHGARGLNFTAIDQSEETTRRRVMSSGASWVCESQGVIVATAAYRFPLGAELLELSSSARVPATGWLNQLAVHPDHRGRGHARELFRVVCRRARVDGVRIIGLDTAEPAEHLRSLYARWGFVEQETIHWPGKTYDSVVMTRELADENSASIHAS